MKGEIGILLIYKRISWHKIFYSDFCALNNLAFKNILHSRLSKNKMQERHKNRLRYFNEQAQTTKKFVIPFIEETTTLSEDSSILEIGCGEGGNLKPFLDMGCKRVVGIDMSKGKIENAKVFFDEHPQKSNVEFILSDIYEISESDIGKFDVIFMRDVLEHIHNQEKFMEFVKRFCKPTTKFFLGFPPWQNPFGGHQQMCESKILSKLPYYHILPKFMYRAILKAFGESESKIEGLLEVKDTRISIERFERIIKRTGYKKDKRTLYLFNPNYEIKLGIKPRKQIPPFTWIPYFRNYIITTNYYVISLQ